jgi:hypothetical protein
MSRQTTCPRCGSKDRTQLGQMCVPHYDDTTETLLVHNRHPWHEEPICIKAPCPMTGGYGLGGGMHICWLHAMSHLPQALLDGAKFVALVPTALLTEVK